MSDAPLLFDAAEADFEQTVLARSAELPVVVDFWAPWCGPCRTLGPILERQIAGPRAGQLALAKVNVDDNPALAARYRVQGIPAVMVFRNREIVAQFVGALPEARVAEVLARVLPTRADERLAAARAAREAGDPAGAEACALEALAEDRLHAGAWALLGRLREERGALADAVDAYSRVPGNGPEAAEAARRAAALKLRLEAEAGPDEATLRARIEASPEDLEARYALGMLQAARGDHREALEQLLEVVRRDRKFRDDGARRAMLEVFEAAGSRSPLSDEFRSRLASVLY